MEDGVDVQGAIVWNGQTESDEAAGLGVRCSLGEEQCLGGIAQTIMMCAVSLI